ncbi:MAG: hypothetical protein R6V47_04035 [Candidatus Delongbacteria bacterium]
MSLFSYFKFDDRTDPRIKIAAYLSFIAAFGLSGWVAMLTNFSVEKLDLSAFDMGIVLSVKEISVIFGFVISILLGYVSESRLQGILVALAGTGIILTGFSAAELPVLENVYSFLGSENNLLVNLAVFAFIVSLTYKYFESSRDSLIKHSTDSQTTALMLGKITAYSLFGTASGYFAVTILGFFSFDYFYIICFSILGLPMIIGGITGTKKAKPTKSFKDNIELIIRGKFFNFYILTFLTSSVNIILVFFGVFLLVKEFGTGLGFIGLIFLIHSALAFFFRHKASELMKAKGEDFTMKIRYGVTFLFFITIAFLPMFTGTAVAKFTILVLVAVYGLSTLFDNSIKSFISYFATQAEQRSNLLIYTRLNQLSNVLSPILAGWLWINYGYHSAFALGALFSAICFLISFRIYAAYKDADPEETGVE